MWVVALEPGDERYTETAGEKGIFAVSFLAASPARIAEDVDVGRPEGETVIAASVVVGHGVIVFAARFSGDNVGDTMKEVGIPGGREADGLRENSGGASTGDPVKAFVPPVVGGDLEARDRRGHVLHLGDFFLGGEAREEISDTLFDGERGIEVGRIGGLGERDRGQKEERDKKNF